MIFESIKYTPYYVESKLVTRLICQLKFILYNFLKTKILINIDTITKKKLFKEFLFYPS